MIITTRYRRKSPIPDFTPDTVAWYISSWNPESDNPRTWTLDLHLAMDLDKCQVDELLESIKDRADSWITQVIS